MCEPVNASYAALQASAGDMCESVGGTLRPGASSAQVLEAGLLAQKPNKSVGDTVRILALVCE